VGLQSDRRTGRGAAPPPTITTRGAGETHAGGRAENQDELAIALAAMLEERGGVGRAVAALEQLGAELDRALGDRSRVA